MAVPFVTMSAHNTLRRRLLDDVVDTTLIAVQTRETVLRVLNSTMGPMFARLASQKEALQVTICEKRQSIEIEADLADLVPFYQSGARDLLRYGVPIQQVDLILEALGSGSPILQVAGKCATILLAAFIEMDSQNG